MDSKKSISLKERPMAFDFFAWLTYIAIALVVVLQFALLVWVNKL